MNKSPAAHPSTDDLVAFAHGRLHAEQSENIESHVADCDSCCEFLKRVPDDGLLNQLRAQAETLDGSPGGDTATGSEVASSEAGHDEIPAELRDHPRYEVRRVLGAGGMGVVYEAQHRMMGRRVALKVINRKLISMEGAVDRFEREVVAAGSLSHRNIVTAHDAEQAGDLHFLVMEFVDGVSLAELIKKLGPLPIKHACNYAMQTALGLQHAFERGMVHRDIKPQNLMRENDGRIKILDFGLARLANDFEQEQASEALTGEGVTLGTPDFIAPEQARSSRTADIRADIYSLGCTLFYLLCGQPPFPEGTAIEKILAHCERTPPSILDRRPDAPPALAEVLRRMMAKSPDERYSTPQQVVEALRPLGSSSTDPKSGATEKRKKPAVDSRPESSTTQSTENPIVVPPAAPPAEPPPQQAAQPTDQPVAQPVTASPSRATTPATINAERPADPTVLAPLDPLSMRPKAAASTATAGSEVLRWGAVGGGAVVALILLIMLTPLFTGGGNGDNSNETSDPQSGMRRPGNEQASTEPSANREPFQGANNGNASQPAAAVDGTARVLIVVPFDGYWYDDYDPVRRMLDAAGITVDVASSQKPAGNTFAKSHPLDASNGKHRVAVDVAIENTDPSRYDAVVFIGGNTEEFSDQRLAVTAQLINGMLAEDKLVASLCKGSEILAASGALQDRDAAVNEYIRPELLTGSGANWTDKHPYVESGNILTGRHYRDAEPFARFLVDRLKD